MTLASLAQAVYVIAAILFILSLAGLSKQTTARRGALFGMTGMILALGATIALSLDSSERPPLVTAILIALVLIVGASLGTWQARRVEMTQMPEMIAMLHSFVGLSAVLVGVNSYLTEAHADPVHLVEVFLGIFIGAITFTGSIVAYLKLSARIKSSPLKLPGRNMLNLGGLLVSAALMAWFLTSPSIVPLLLLIVVSLAIAGTSSRPSAAETCPSSSPCSTRTQDGLPPRPGSCSATTCSSSSAPSSGPPARSCPTSCAPP